MDQTLVTATAAALVPSLPYLLQKAGDMAADEAIKKVGEAAWNCAKSIWRRLSAD